MSMIPVNVPTLGESISEATIARWIKSDGDYVTPNDAIAELETDKANVEIVPSAPGVLKTTKKKGDTVAVGEAIAQIDTAGKPGAAATPAAAPTEKAPAAAGGTVDLKSTPLDDLSPAVRTLVLENKLQSASIPASGPHGRLTKEDILSFLERQSTPTPDATAAANATRQQSSGGAISSPGTTSVPARTKTETPALPARALAADEEREEMTKLRQTIARRLVESQHTTASLTTYNEVDMSAIMALREKYKSDFEKTYGIGLGFMSFFAKAVISALRQVPQVNYSIDGNTLIKRKNVHLGVAVSTERGLMVPVIKNAQDLSMAKIESEIKRLALKARDGKIAIDDMTGGTFTLTNGGTFGSLLSTPILNPPQSGILGMHKIEKRAVVVTEAGKDAIVIRPMMYLALTYDHRVIDGKQSVTFLVKVKEALEDPARMLLEM